MAKKKKSKSEETEEIVDETPSKETKKPKFEWDPSDSITWHDFVGLFLMVFIFIWRIIRLILAPIFWIYAENVRMWRFIRAVGHDRVMNDDERMFVESIPFIYSSTGLVGGILLGLFAALSFNDVIEEFINSINLDFFKAIFSAIGWFLSLIYNAIVWVFTGIYNMFAWLYNLIASVFQINPLLAFTVLILIGVVVMLFWIAIVEKGILSKVTGLFVKLFNWLIGSPDRFRIKVNNIYRRINHKLTKALVGTERLHTRTQVYFKKVTLYTFALSIYSFFAGIFVAVNPEQYGTLDTTFMKVLFASLVLMIAGIFSGVVAFAGIARFYDAINREKYIAEEFRVGDKVDKDKIDKFVESSESRIKSDLDLTKEELDELEAKAKEEKEESD